MGEGEGGAVELYRIEKRQRRSGGGGRLNLDEGLGRRVTGPKAWLVSDRNLEMRALHAMESSRMGEQAAADANSDLRRITLAPKRT